MTPQIRKILFAAIPIALGLGVFALLGGLNSFKSKPAATGTKTAPPVVPENPAHEKASLEEQLKKNPNHPPILLRLAEIENTAGHPAEAQKYLRQALERDSSNVDARLELSKSLYETGKTEDAIAEAKRLLADHPNQVDALYNLGAIYANQGALVVARQYWTQAIAADANSESGKKAQDGLAKIGN